MHGRWSEETGTPAHTPSGAPYMHMHASTHMHGGRWSEETDTPAHTPSGAPVESLLLRPRSVLIFCDTAYREHCHEVAPLADGVEVSH